MTEIANREALKALAWVVVKDFMRAEAKKGRAGRRTKRREHLAVHGTLANRPREAPEASSVYVISGDQHPVKVGHSKDVVARLATLQTGSPVRLAVYSQFTVPADLAVAIEARAHALLAERRLSGEWFSVTGHEAEDAVMLAIQQIVPRS